MNGSDVCGSSAPYGDVLPVFKWDSVDRGGSGKLSLNSVLHKNYNS